MFGVTGEVFYEISHNLVQEETLVLPDGSTRAGFVHRKGATRAFPAGHPDLDGTPWADTGHPCLVPGSMLDGAAILFPLEGAYCSACSVNHGAGRVMARGQAKRDLAISARRDRCRDARHRSRTLGGVPIRGIVGNTERTPLDECGHVYKELDEVLRVLESGRNRARRAAAVSGREHQGDRLTHQSSLEGKVALVAGATRGAGRGIAVELGAAGATVYVTGRTTREQQSEYARRRPSRRRRSWCRGRRQAASPCRSITSSPSRSEKLVARIRAEQGRLDVLVNDVWGGETLKEWNKPVWEHDLENGLRLLQLGVRHAPDHRALRAAAA